MSTSTGVMKDEFWEVSCRLAALVIEEFTCTHCVSRITGAVSGFPSVSTSRCDKHQNCESGGLLCQFRSVVYRNIHTSHVSVITGVKYAAVVPGHQRWLHPGCDKNNSCERGLHRFRSVFYRGIHTHQKSVITGVKAAAVVPGYPAVDTPVV